MAKILYVEDNEDNVYMLQRRLTRKVLMSSLQRTVRLEWINLNRKIQI